VSEVQIGVASVERSLVFVEPDPSVVERHEEAGPYVSQLLLRSFDYGAYHMGGTINVHVPGIDYITTLDRWLASQRGLGPFPYKDGIKFDTPARYIRTGRDLARYVHTDPLGGIEAQDRHLAPAELLARNCRPCPAIT